MVLNITHGATNTFVHPTKKFPLYPYPYIYVIHRDLFILLATFFPLILLPLQSLVLFILPPSQRDTMRLPFYSISKSQFFLFLSLFELSHFIRVDKTIFYPCKIKKNAIWLLPSSNVHNEKSHLVYEPRPEICEWKKTHAQRPFGVSWVGNPAFSSSLPPSLVTFIVDNLISPVVRIISFKWTL